MQTLRQKAEFSDRVERFFSRKGAEDSRLILDGTGPRVTMHLPYLAGMGESISRFKEVHAFSGGVFAYLIAKAYKLGFCRYSVAHYCTELDRFVRRKHRQPILAYPKMLKQYRAGTPIYDIPVHREIVRYSFVDEYLKMPLLQAAPELIAYAAKKGKAKPVAVLEANGFDRSTLTVEQMLSITLRIPFLYSDPETGDFFDATYASGFLAHRRRLVAEPRSTLLLSMWTKDSLGEIESVNVLSTRRPKQHVKLAIFLLLFNLPNRQFRRDILNAYG